MAEYVLNAQPRTLTGKKVRKLRREGFVPFIVYGPKTDPINLQAQYRELEKTLLAAGGTNLIDINIEGSDPLTVLARDVQRDVVRGSIKHVDFFAISEDARVVVEVPVMVTGESAAVTARKGILLTGPNSLSIEMRVTNMLDQITVDLSNFPEVGDSLYVRDLNLGENARILNDPEEMVIRIAQPSAARREEALEIAASMAEGEEGEGEGEEAEDDGSDEE